MKIETVQTGGHATGYRERGAGMKIKHIVTLTRDELRDAISEYVENNAEDLYPRNTVPELVFEDPLGENTGVGSARLEWSETE